LGAFVKARRTARNDPFDGFQLSAPQFSFLIGLGKDPLDVTIGSSGYRDRHRQGDATHFNITEQLCLSLIEQVDQLVYICEMYSEFSGNLRCLISTSLELANFSVQSVS